MKFIVGLLTLLFLVGGVRDAIAQTEYDYVRDVWPELLEMPHDHLASPIQWFIHPGTAIGNATKEEVQSARARLKLIQAEAAAHPEIEWAGIYVKYASEIGHIIIAVSPQAGFLSFETVGCGVGLSSIQFGKVSFDDVGLKLLPDENRQKLAVKNDNPYHDKYIKKDVAYVPIKWNEANFLVLKKYVANFCDEFFVGGKVYSVNGIEQFDLSPLPLMKLGGAVNNETLAPILPAKYSHLAKRPILATVKTLGAPKFRREIFMKEENWELRRTVILHQGSAKGIKQGMQLITPARDAEYKINLHITHVEADYSVGKYTLSVPAKVKPDAAELKKFLKDNDLHQGSKLRSYSRWYEIQGI